MKKLNAIVFAVLLMAGSATAQVTWNTDRTHSNITFTVTHMVVAEVSGSFKDFSGKVVTTNDDFSDADIEFTAKVDSINTGNKRRDNHLRSDDFFNSAKFPDIKFAGKLVKEGGKYLLKGKFTMRDVTKDVVFDAVYRGSVKTGQGEKAGFKITGTVKRFDYGLKWSSTIEAGGSLAVADEVQILCNVELNKAK